MADNMNCSKCGGELAEGFVIDRSHGGAKTEQMWVEGIPESSLLSGLQTADRAIYNVRAFRCNECGFLDYYADIQATSDGLLNKFFGG